MIYTAAVSETILIPLLAADRFVEMSLLKYLRDKNVPNVAHRAFLWDWQQ